MRIIFIYFFVAALSVGTHSWTMQKKETKVVNEYFVNECVKKILEEMPDTEWICWLPFPLGFLESELKNKSLKLKSEAEELKFLEDKKDSLLDSVKKTKNGKDRHCWLDYISKLSNGEDDRTEFLYSIFRSREKSLTEITGSLFPETKSLDENPINNLINVISNVTRGKMWLWYNEYFLDPSLQQKMYGNFNKYKDSDYLKKEVFGPFLGKPIGVIRNKFKNDHSSFLKKEILRVLEKSSLIDQIVTLAIAKELAPNQSQSPDQGKKNLKDVLKS